MTSFVVKKGKRQPRVITDGHEFAVKLLKNSILHAFVIFNFFYGDFF